MRKRRGNENKTLNKGKVGRDHPVKHKLATTCLKQVSEEEKVEES
jgi:hypothetical protein